MAGTQTRHFAGTDKKRRSPKYHETTPKDFVSVRVISRTVVYFLRLRNHSAEWNQTQDAVTASSKISRATSMFSRVIISGGDQRMVFKPAPRMMRPRSKQAYSIFSRNSGAGLRLVLFSTISTPTIKP